ncbi:MULTISPECIES: DUF2878 domain-containing protein [unclassified Pseudomonas]|uniref:DUF2878 domain-containing protein n=1 Tax=unclassified Pseudomonas TaxID=196821 RepID=UPI002096865F|nr:MULTISPECIES: DUF2878 domain-containing protein [unclassified Pseudomonas]MCO7521802.1 DUF2878 domain-containing protein [Pseudomonas sp. 1]MCO7538989.1 DUF2878 domain-containing protein [Pseudomonas sp. VA159-2]
MQAGRLIFNALWLQAGWWVCVLGAERRWLLWLVIPGLAVHLRLCQDANAEAWAMVRITLAGCLLDSALGALGLFVFDAWPLPLWLALLWLVLASGMRHSLAWAGDNWRLGSLLGALGGPLAYVGGATLAGVALPLGAAQTGLLLAPVWALALPMLVRLATWR